MFTTFPLIAITPPLFIEDEADKITQLLNAGIHRVHIRIPDSDSDQISHLIQQIPTALHHRLSLHQHFHLALQYHCGIQTNSRHPLPLPHISIHSHSCHSLAEVAQMRHCNYVTLSPIFNSISKVGYYANPDLLQEIENTDMKLLPPIIALGGIQFHKIAQLRNAGFSGAAMLGEIWNCDFQETIKKIKAECSNS